MKTLFLGEETTMKMMMMGIAKWALKEHLHREGNNMIVFEVDLDADKALTNIDLLE